MATAVRQGIQLPIDDVPLTDEEESAPEGRLVARMHIRRERDASLVAKKKAKALKETGKLDCEACGFDFSRVYGERGAGYMECHHRTPLSELTPGAKTKMRDLALICANCHRIIHRKPWLRVEDLAEILKASGRPQLVQVENV
jgi:5-methylcytosine-specific restriction protein A